MSKLTKVFSMVIGVAMCFATVTLATGCGEKIPEGTTRVRFTYEADMNINPTFYEMIRRYNDTQGKTDNVYVSADMVQGAGNMRATYEGQCESSVVMLSDEVFKDIAIDGLFLDLTEYAERDQFDFSGMPTGLLNSARMTIGKKGEKTYTGEGQNLQAMPFGIDPFVLYINRQNFENWGINFISVAENELDAYNEEHGTHYMPHGYAEYAEGNAPATGLTLSENLAGEQVYKVFNNRISTNWEEFRYLAKCFTRSYRADSPTPNGFVTGWWFPFGWSVGGDCIGWDGEKYNFTLMDETPNYLATKEVTVNGKTYSAGDLITYEDKVNADGIAGIDGLFELPSQREAVTEFLRYSLNRDYAVDGSGTEGYQIMPSNFALRLGNFTNNTVSMVCEQYSEQYYDMTSSNIRDKYDYAPVWQYRQYQGGSTYQKNGSSGFENEYLKVIGNEYDGQKFTGALEYENGTPIVGASAVQGKGMYLVIPKNSDPAKYEAAWKFISWATGEEAQKIMTKAFVPVRQTVAENEFLEFDSKYNLWAVAHTAMNFDIGDWSYFQNGEWVTDWSGDFNDQLRKGNQTIGDFLHYNESKASSACANTNIVIKGRR